MTSSKSWFLGSWSNPIFSIKVIKFINQSSFKLYYFQSFQRDCGVAIKGNANLTNMTCKWFFFTINLQISDAPFGKMTQSYCCWTSLFISRCPAGCIFMITDIAAAPWSQVSFVSFLSLLWFYHPPPSQTATVRRTESSSSARLVKQRPVPGFLLCNNMFLH